MSSDVCIAARGLGKKYQIYAKPHHRLLDMLSPSAERGRAFWALRDVDFSIKKGETVGIVGRNGSGKSTLLQIVSGTVSPSEGSVEVIGRVAALLELGTGFNPEFTGRENIRLNAAVLGLEGALIDSRMQAILDFADIGEFVDEPVRTYSSGMYIRLAFAVAISVNPDVLIIDEALSVGDEAFQRKCFARIEQMKRDGATILFVSHSASMVTQLCDRAILLDGGRRIMTGEPKAVVARYQKLINAPAAERAAILDQICKDDARMADELPLALEDPVLSEVDGAEIPLSKISRSESTHWLDANMKPASTLEYASLGARILAPHLETDAGEAVNVLSPRKTYVYCYDVEFDRDVERVHFGMMVKSVSGVELSGMASHAHGDAIPLVRAGSRIRVQFELAALMVPGTYFLNAGVMGVVNGQSDVFVHRIVDAVMFRIDSTQTNRRLDGFFDISVEPAVRLTLIPSEAR